MNNNKYKEYFRNELEELSINMKISKLNVRKTKRQRYKIRKGNLILHFRERVR